MNSDPIDVAIIGGGPAGLMAAETARAAGLRVCVFERMGSAGRKFLIAGKGGLNLTHAEPATQFLSRYTHAAPRVASWLADFDSSALRRWAADLGIATFVGSSGRVFPDDLKAAPLMRGWLRRLRAQGVAFQYDRKCVAIAATAGGLRLTFVDSAGSVATQHAKAVVLAMGGGSWAKLGSDGTWVDMLRNLGLRVHDLQPSNCGFVAHWSDALRKHAGTPIKSITAYVGSASAKFEHDVGAAAIRGEAMLTDYGLEGSVVYALSSALRAQILTANRARLTLDLCPDHSQTQLENALAAQRAGMSLSEKLKRAAKLSAVKRALFYEGLAPVDRLDSFAKTAQRLKALTLEFTAMRPMDEAISTAGGVDCMALTAQLMVPSIPGLFCAGEMLDWDAPTGGYLLNACFASGKRAGAGVLGFLAETC
jgi:uncharacterized flavoprotein (TIGR03862 family)